MESVRRALGLVDPDEEERQPRLADYLFYQEAFQVALGDSLVSAARARSHEILMSFRMELQSARDSANEAGRRIAAGGSGSFDPLLDFMVQSL
jgi:hypothetical protein